MSKVYHVDYIAPAPAADAAPAPVVCTSRLRQVGTLHQHVLLITLRLCLLRTLHLHLSSSTFRLRQVGTQHQHLSLTTLRLCLHFKLHQHLEQVRLKKPSVPVEFRRAVACCADQVVETICGSSLKCTNLIASVDRTFLDEIQFFRAKTGNVKFASSSRAPHPCCNSSPPDT